MNGAELLVKSLLDEKISYVFGYPGVSICPFFDALIESPIKSILLRNEQDCGHAASGYARVNNTVGVCAVSSGPGATNLITAIATAFADSIPLVCITGQVPTEHIGSDMFQEADIIGSAESFVKYSYLVRDAKELPRIVKEAFYIASTGRKGPVLIDLPIDIQMT
ncbi:MAG: acetolactate synthase, large subunit, biosynthetic type, partial [Lachnospiraceae bacterium]|nr:acetolactate synthase, large subunit, biosynthetic type [Lachnospiraceae bacterium]